MPLLCQRCAWWGSWCVCCGAPPRSSCSIGLLRQEGSWTSRHCADHPFGAREPVFPYLTPLGLFLLKRRVPVRMEVESEI